MVYLIQQLKTAQQLSQRHEQQLELGNRELRHRIAARQINGLRRRSKTNSATKKHRDSLASVDFSFWLVLRCNRQFLLVAMLVFVIPRQRGCRT